jgi:hypothetical protein
MARLITRTMHLLVDDVVVATAGHSHASYRVTSTRPHAIDGWTRVAGRNTLGEHISRHHTNDTEVTVERSDRRHV